ncbi:hypothetical protein QFZ71_003182 [Streptomyces sp. V2I9]|nr:hypothetical protein [Streptomyces sp. V2I9]
MTALLRSEKVSSIASAPCVITGRSCFLHTASVVA